MHNWPINRVTTHGTSGLSWGEVSQCGKGLISIETTCILPAFFALKTSVLVEPFPFQPMWDSNTPWTGPNVSQFVFLPAQKPPLDIVPSIEAATAHRARQSVALHVVM